MTVEGAKRVRNHEEQVKQRTILSLTVSLLPRLFRSQRLYFARRGTVSQRYLSVSIVQGSGTRTIVNNVYIPVTRRSCDNAYFGILMTEKIREMSGACGSERRHCQKVRHAVRNSIDKRQSQNLGEPKIAYTFIDSAIRWTFFTFAIFLVHMERRLCKLSRRHIQRYRDIGEEEELHLLRPLGSSSSSSNTSASNRMLKVCRTGITMLFDARFRLACTNRSAARRHRSYSTASSFTASSWAYATRLAETGRC